MCNAYIFHFRVTRSGWLWVAMGVWSTWPVTRCWPRSPRRLCTPLATDPTPPGGWGWWPGGRGRPWCPGNPCCAPAATSSGTAAWTRGKQTQVQQGPSNSLCQIIFLNFVKNHATPFYNTTQTAASPIIFANERWAIINELESDVDSSSFSRSGLAA